MKEYVPFLIYLTALAVAGVLGGWLGQMPEDRRAITLRYFAAGGVLILVGLAVVTMPPPPASP